MTPLCITKPSSVKDIVVIDIDIESCVVIALMDWAGSCYFKIAVKAIVNFKKI